MISEIMDTVYKISKEMGISIQEAIGIALIQSIFELNETLKEKK